jgi:hypothetical protein
MTRHRPHWRAPAIITYIKPVWSDNRCRKAPPCLMQNTALFCPRALKPLPELLSRYRGATVIALQWRYSAATGLVRLILMRTNLRDWWGRRLLADSGMSASGRRSRKADYCPGTQRSPHPAILPMPSRSPLLSRDSASQERNAQTLLWLQRPLTPSPSPGFCERRGWHPNGGCSEIAMRTFRYRKSHRGVVHAGAG